MQSMRDVDISQFQMPPRKGKGEIDDVLMSPRERDKIRRILSLHRQGFTAKSITRMVCCPDAASLASELELSVHDLDTGWKGDNGIERPVAERQDEIFQARLRDVRQILNKFGEEPIQTEQPNTTTRRTDCIAPSRA